MIEMTRCTSILDLLSSLSHIQSSHSYTASVSNVYILMSEIYNRLGTHSQWALSSSNNVDRVNILKVTQTLNCRPPLSSEQVVYANKDLHACILGGLNDSTMAYFNCIMLVKELPLVTW